jgi:hypothetical protein
MAGIVAWAARQKDKPPRSEAIRRLVELGLARSTKPPARRSEKNAAKAKDLAAKTIDNLVEPLDVPSELKASRKRRLLKGPEEFREVRVDRSKK